jgi:hypothetical protein
MRPFIAPRAPAISCSVWGAADLTFQSALDGLALPSNAPDASEKFGFIADCMSHSTRLRLVIV